MKESIKHHYIPRFYLKGFTDNHNQFFVYDKKENKIWKSSPDNSFYENHRNTGVIKNLKNNEITKSDLPETILSRFDSRSAKVINEIKSSISSDKILTAERISALRYFIISTFWRIPANDKLRENIIEKNSFEELGFGFFDKDGKKDNETEAVLKETDLWRKTYPSILPISAINKKYNKTNSDDWKLLYRDNNFHLITDNPILLKEYVDLSSLQEELIIPLSSKHLLVITKKNPTKIIAPVFSLKIDLLLFRRAKRYVASSDKKYLEFIINEENKLVYEKLDDMLFDSIFNHFL